MLPYVPIIVVADEIREGVAFESESECIFISPKRVESSAVLALVDLSAYLEEKRLIEISGRKVPVGTIYALKCSVRTSVKLGKYFVHYCSVTDRLKLVERIDLKEFSIPIRIGDLLTRADERYITKVRFFPDEL